MTKDIINQTWYFIYISIFFSFPVYMSAWTYRDVQGGGEAGHSDWTLEPNWPKLFAIIVKLVASFDAQIDVPFLNLIFHTKKIASANQS